MDFEGTISDLLIDQHTTDQPPLRTLQSANWPTDPLNNWLINLQYLNKPTKTLYEEVLYISSGPITRILKMVLD